MGNSFKKNVYKDGEDIVLEKLLANKLYKKKYNNNKRELRKLAYILSNTKKLKDTYLNTNWTKTESFKTEISEDINRASTTTAPSLDDIDDDEEEEEKEEEEKPTVEEEFERKRAPYIIVSNHVSLLDTLVLGWTCNILSFVGKGSLSKLPIVGQLGKQLNVLFITKANKHTIIERLRNRCKAYYNLVNDHDLPPQLVIFPEGTTTRSDVMTGFHRGAFIGKPVNMYFIRYPYNHFCPAWTDTPSFLRYFLLLMSQWIQQVEVYRFPVYYPNEKEKQDETLYAEHVRRVMAYTINERLKKKKNNNQRFIQLIPALYCRYLKENS